MPTSTRRVLPGLAAVALWASAPAQAQELGDLIDRLAASYPAGAQAQEEVDALDDARSRLEREYVRARRRADALRTYVEQLRRARARQGERSERLEGELERVVEVSRELVPLMERMVDALERFVALDAPFLGEERAARVGRLRALLDEAETPDAEKFRRVLEAYAIELEYGRTLESYRGRLGEDGPLVRFLRVGRVLLAWASLDGARYGRWDPEAARFVELDPRFGPGVEAALAVAEERAPPEVLVLPVPAPSEAAR